jgi:phospholipid/cholesterol/gamma-HCH transport system substrate-binding protein
MPDKYNKDLSIEVLVGFFMFMILIALGVFTIVLSRQNFLQKRYPVEIRFDEISGLREGDHVFLRGTKVGAVKATVLDNDHVLVRADLDVPVKFREGYKVEVVSSSMLGGKLLKIYEGPHGAPPVPEEAEIFGTRPIDILEELATAVASIKEMTSQVAAGEGTLGKLIRDDTLYNQLEGIMNNVHQISDRLAAGQGTLGKLLSEDDAFYQDLSASAANIRSITAKIDSGEGMLGKLLSEDEPFYHDLSASAANIRSITEKIDSGEGTLGKLISDEEIYVEAKKLLGEVRAAIDDMRETSPVTTFSTIFFGAF